MIALPSGEVKLWLVDLAAPFPEGENGLSPAELKRAEAFVFPADRRRYLAAHVALRAILSACLGRPPQALTFRANGFGKPELLDPGDRWLRFNLSHSGDRALIACAREREVGADLEAIRDGVDCAEIVARFFSPEERREWEGLPDEWRRAGFFHGWSRKEAYVKALGEGLSHAPEAYTVAIDPRRPARLIGDRLAPGAERRWSVRAVPAPPGFAAAVAHAGGEAEVSAASPIELGFGLEPLRAPREDSSQSHVTRAG